MGYAERFFAKVNKRGPLCAELGTRCWLWTAADNGKGYPVFQDRNGKRDYAHRISWTEKNGPIPEGLTIDHLCRNRRCVRPSHLEPCSLAENIRRAAAFRPSTKQSHCHKGHPLSGENVRVDPRSGNRTCKTCAREWAAAKRRSQGARERGTFRPRNNTVLTEDQITQIRSLYSAGTHSQSELGAMFGVSQTSVGRYVRGERYADI